MDVDFTSPVTWIVAVPGAIVWVWVLRQVVRELWYRYLNPQRHRPASD